MTGDRDPILGELGEMFDRRDPVPEHVTQAAELVPEILDMDAVINKLSGEAGE